jgi:hypothetical protein
VHGGSKANEGSDDDDDAPEEISFRQGAPADEAEEEEVPEARQRGKRGGKRQRLDPAVLAAVATTEELEVVEVGEEEDGEGSAQPTFAGQHTTFDSDDDEPVVKNIRPVVHFSFLDGVCTRGCHWFPCLHA